METTVPREVFTGDGHTTMFTFSFDYLRKSFVKATVDDIILPFIIEGKTITFDTPPASGAVVVVYRETSTSRLVSWNDASVLRAKDMTIQQVQVLHLTEEERVWVEMNTLTNTGDGFNAHKHKIINVADPTNPQDVVTKHYMESVQDGFVSQNKELLRQTEAARDKAKVSETNAKASEGNAKASERASKLSEDNAKTSEGNAKTSEANAETSKTEAGKFAVNASQSAQAAKAWAEAVGSPDGTASKSSKTWAGLAKTSADSAKENAGLTTNAADVAIRAANGASAAANLAKKDADRAELAVSKVSYATTATAGIVKPNSSHFSIGDEGALTIKQAIFDNVNSELAKKADKGKLSMPTSKYIKVNASTTDYKMPIDGWVRFEIKPQHEGNAYVDITPFTHRVDNVSDPSYYHTVMFPLAKGASFKVKELVNYTVLAIYVYYAESEV